MKGVRWFGSVGVVVALGVAGSGVSAGASGHAPFMWRSPNKITSGAPAEVASIMACPTPPPGTTILVQINLALGNGGSSSQVLAANADGSWSGAVTFYFSTVDLRQTSIGAECLAFTGVTATPYAAYKTRHAQVFDTTPS